LANPIRLSIAGLLVLTIAADAPVGAAKADRVTLRHVTLELPGPPSAVVPADLDGDGRLDLAIAVAYTEIEEIGFDRIEGMVQITTVVPALFDRREVHAFLRRDDGTFARSGRHLELPFSVLSMEAGPPGHPVIALTDEGLAELRFDPGADGPDLQLVPLLRDPPVMAGTGTFFSSLDVVHDVDGDGRDDVLVPTHSGPAVYLTGEDGLTDTPVDRAALPGESHGSRRAEVWRFIPYPEVRDVDGDGIPDLLVRRSGSRTTGVHLMIGQGGGRFAPLRDAPADCWDDGTQLRVARPVEDGPPWLDDVTAVRDLDGDGRAEIVTATERDRGDGLRKEMKDAKRPIYHYRFHRLDESMSILPDPYFDMEAEGHAFEIDDEELGIFSVQQFDDLDGDGREDLVTVTLKFSMWQAVRILTTKRISIGLDFHVWAQQEDGRFVEVEGLDLSEKFKLDLNNLTLGRFAQFAGDFDGDGRKDFVHLGRGKEITIHRGQPGCRYPKEPDLVIPLAAEPESLELVQIRDLDGDGRADIMITRPLPETRPDETPPVQLDLYLSGGAS
jgi:hypothetical protein